MEVPPLYSRPSCNIITIRVPHVDPVNEVLSENVNSDTQNMFMQNSLIRGNDPLINGWSTADRSHSSPPLSPISVVDQIPSLSSPQLRPNSPESSQSIDIRLDDDSEDENRYGTYRDLAGYMMDYQLDSEDDYDDDYEYVVHTPDEPHHESISSLCTEYYPRLAQDWDIKREAGIPILEGVRYQLIRPPCDNSDQTFVCKSRGRVYKSAKRSSPRHRLAYKIKLGIENADNYPYSYDDEFNPELKTTHLLYSILVPNDFCKLIIYAPCENLQVKLVLRYGVGTVLKLQEGNNLLCPCNLGNPGKVKEALSHPKHSNLRIQVSQPPPPQEHKDLVEGGRIDQVLEYRLEGEQLTHEGTKVFYLAIVSHLEESSKKTQVQTLSQLAKVQVSKTSPNW